MQLVAAVCPESTGRRAIILITDGYDENSITTVDEALERAEIRARDGVCGRDRRRRRHLAEGRARAAAPRRRNRRPDLSSRHEDQLQVVHAALADDVQNRYLLTYTPANQRQDGKWREISVQVA